MNRVKSKSKELNNDLNLVKDTSQYLLSKQTLRNNKQKSYEYMSMGSTAKIVTLNDITHVTDDNVDQIMSNASCNTYPICFSPINIEPRFLETDGEKELKVQEKRHDISIKHYIETLPNPPISGPTDDLPAKVMNTAPTLKSTKIFGGQGARLRSI